MHLEMLLSENCPCAALFVKPFFHKQTETRTISNFDKKARRGARFEHGVTFQTFLLCQLVTFDVFISDRNFDVYFILF